MAQSTATEARRGFRRRRMPARSTSRHLRRHAQLSWFDAQTIPFTTDEPTGLTSAMTQETWSRSGRLAVPKRVGLCQWWPDELDPVGDRNRLQGALVDGAR